jgi:hypothetical protein
MTPPNARAPNAEAAIIRRRLSILISRFGARLYISHKYH